MHSAIRVFLTPPYFSNPVYKGMQPVLLIIYMPDGSELNSYKIDHRPDIGKIPDRDTVSSITQYQECFKIYFIQSPVVVTNCGSLQEALMNATSDRSRFRCSIAGALADGNYRTPGLRDVVFTQRETPKRTICQGF